MSELPPSPAPLATPFDQADHDTSQLRTVSIFWYILAALQALVGCFVSGWLALVVLASFGMASSGRADDAAVGATFGGFFGCFGLFAIILWWGLAFLDFTVARSLPRRKNRTLCFFMAAWACLIFPLGTVLGVFTLMLLTRPSIRASSL